jgi:hypothetical protein
MIRVTSADPYENRLRPRTPHTAKAMNSYACCFQQVVNESIYRLWLGHRKLLRSTVAWTSVSHNMAPY